MTTGLYTFQCTHAGCGAQRVMTIAGGLGLKVGDPAPTDTANPAWSACLRCHRIGMRVIQTPEAPPAPGPVGFTRVPTR